MSPRVLSESLGFSPRLYSEIHCKTVFRTGKVFPAESVFPNEGKSLNCPKKTWSILNLMYCKKPKCVCVCVS